MSTDPSGDLYELMDKAGLSGGNMLQGTKAIGTIVGEVRLKLNNELVTYIETRDELVAANAYKKGREYEQARQNS